MLHQYEVKEGRNYHFHHEVVPKIHVLRLRVHSLSAKKREDATQKQVITRRVELPGFFFLADFFSLSAECNLHLFFLEKYPAYSPYFCTLCRYFYPSVAVGLL